MAPFQAVPSPLGDGDLPAERPLERSEPAPPVTPQAPVPPAAARPLAPPPAPAAKPSAGAPPAPAPPGRGDLPPRDDDRGTPWSTGPTGSRPSPPPYGDWTRPSQGGSVDETPRRALPAELADWLGSAAPVVEPPARSTADDPFARLRADAPAGHEPLTAPGTTAIPEREVSRGRAAPDRALADRAAVDRAGDRDLDRRGARGGRRRDDDTADDARPAADRDDPPTGPPTGGRAAQRAERQAAEAARRKAARKGAPTRADDGGPRRSPRRMALGLVAVAVVALGVLGVYSFASPNTKASSAQTALSNTAAPPPITGALPSDLPAIASGGITGESPATSSTAAAPIRLPVTVLNSTKVNGLAGKISGAMKNAGWPEGPVGAYDGKDVAATTVFFTQGDENQRQAALQLIEQFPQVQGPAPRFFDMPAGAPAGLVVVATGDWQP